MTIAHKIGTLLLFSTLLAPPIARADDATVLQQIQQVLDNYVAQRHDVEGISGVSLHIDLGERAPVMDVFSGTDGRRVEAPIDGDTLFQIGSNTKHFEAAVVLQLEAKGQLKIDQTVGDWLPQYPRWRNVTIRQLLNMTSPIPNYSETPDIGRIIASDLHHQFTNRELVAAAYPTTINRLPIPTGWFYSNTNNILAALIIQKASGMPLKRALERLIFAPIGLHNTFYSDGVYPVAVQNRLPRGLYQNAACLLYQLAPCKRSILTPLIGKDMRTQNLSWAGGAGAIVSNPRDLAKWIRALFGGKVLPPQQLSEMTTLVSERTGKPLTEPNGDDPMGFGLDIAAAYRPELGGRFWYYEGMTLGYRAIFAFWPQSGLVMTVATNSQAPEGEDQLGDQVLGKVLAILTDAKIVNAAPPMPSAAGK